MPDPSDFPRVDSASESEDPALPPVEAGAAAASPPSEIDTASSKGGGVEGAREEAGGESGRQGDPEDDGEACGQADDREPEVASVACVPEDGPVPTSPADTAPCAAAAAERGVAGASVGRAASDRSQQMHKSADARGATRRVLLADNDPNVAAILELFLRKSGAEVVSVPHGEAALEALTTAGFGLLVCDLDMPVMSGEELLDRIGSDPSTPPVFVISGYVDEVTSARLRSHRAVVDVLRKPFDLRAFAARVADLLDGRGVPGPDAGLGLFGEA